MPATGDRITKRKDGLYMGRYTVQTPDGPKRKTIYGKRYRDVEKELNEARANADQGLVFDAGKLTTAEYLDRWLADSVKDTVRTRTYERYDQLVRVHISPTLGRVKLKNVTPAHVRGLYREKLEAGLAPRTVQYIHRTLSKTLKQAVMDGLIPRNAAAAVKPPQARREEIQPLSREQVQVFLETVAGDRLEALYVVAITAGLRQGELLALRWEDLDLDAGMLQVRRTLSETRDGRIFEPPKSQSAPEGPARGEATARLSPRICICPDNGSGRYLDSIRKPLLHNSPRCGRTCACAASPHARASEAYWACHPP